MSEIKYDLAIVGGGTAGMLALSRLAKSNSDPTSRIILIESENHTGGRLCGMESLTSGSWESPLSAVSPELYEYMAQTLRLDPDASDLESIISHRQEKIGSLAAGSISEVDSEDFFSVKGARCIAGAAAAREWAFVEKWAEEENEDSEKKEQTLANLWKGSRKSPLAVTLEHIARASGVPNIWHCIFRSLRDRATFFSKKPYFGPWRQVFNQWEKNLKQDSRIEFELGNPVLHAFRREDGDWELSTGKKTIISKQLVVAVPPWSAQSWLRNLDWPKEVLALALKTKPSSLVGLTEKTNQILPDKLPDLLVVPAEQIQVTKTDSNQLCYAATIDYEESLQAPEVLKAVKRLRRAQKKLHAILGSEIQFEDAHLALTPVAWAQPLAPSDLRLMNLAAKNLDSIKGLTFCGDAYGSHFLGDENLLFSTQKSCSISLAP